MTIESIQDFLNLNEIPVIERPPKTFLEIAKQPYYENVWSNIYAFYFNNGEEHNLKELFIDSFIDLILEQRPNKNLDNFYDFEVHTEYVTHKKGRIDILLTNGGKHIIIENKIYHHIEGNDLKDYWDTIVNKNQEHLSIGVILSLDKIDITHKPGAKNFINITHLEFLTRVLANLNNYSEDSHETFEVFLKDFTQTITNLSRKMIPTKDLEFYLKNQEKINDILELNSMVASHIKKECEIAANYFEGVYLDAPRANSRLDNQIRNYVSEDNKNLMLMIRFNPLLEGKSKITIVIKIIDEALVDRNIYNNLTYTETEKRIFNKGNLNTSNLGWAHIAKQEYELSTSEVSNLSKFIVSKINEDDFLSLFRKIERLIGTGNK